MQNHLEIIWILAKTDFKLRYHGSFLGFLWVILKPLLTFSILNFVFSNIFSGGPNYSVNLFTGIILWNFFAEGTMTGMTSLLSKAHIITKIFVPKWIIVIASTLNILLNFLLNLLVLAVFFILYRVYPSPIHILIALGYCLLVYILILTISFLTAPLFLRIRDMNQIWEVLLTAGFYAAPIIYPMTILPSQIQTILYLVNPMTFIISHTKSILVDNLFIFPLHNILYIVIVLASFTLSFVIFRHTARRSIENI